MIRRFEETIFREGSSKKSVLRVLIIEDNPGDVAIVREFLRPYEFQIKISHAFDLKEAKELNGRDDFDAVLLDLGLPGSTGLATLKMALKLKINSPVIVMTGCEDETLALASLRAGAQDYLFKSRLNSDNIIRAIKHGMERRRISEFLKRNAQRFSLLSSATGILTNCEEISSIYTITCKNIQHLLERSLAIGLEFSGTNSIKTIYSESLNPWAVEINNVLGFDVSKKVFQITNEGNWFLEKWGDGRLHEIDGGLEGLLNGRCDTDDCRHLEKLIGMKNVYTIGFLRDERLYGAAFILTSYKIESDDTSIIEAITSQAALNVHKRTIEKELRISEARFRILSKHLEEEVHKRTMDLEESNIRLQHELKARNLAQKSLEKSTDQLKELNATKDKFFNIVAHDLKNPFTSLLGSSELLCENIEQMNSEEIRALATVINDSAKSGYSILQNLLDWSRSQTGLLKYNPETINLSGLIAQNILNIEPLARRKGIEFITKFGSDSSLFADKNMINTILRNLLSNAVKFSYRSGTVIISSWESDGYAIISVKDSGTGISKENIQKLFRIDSKHSLPGTENEQGTGLGLKLCKEFTEKLNGRLTVESTENVGSEFKFSLPLTKDPSMQ
jgi:two-component system, sensor histidine kinase and response regulator